MGSLRSISPALLVALGMITLGGCYTTQPSTEAIETRPIAVAPVWAPPYEDGRAARYYYLPDYELYYDVWDHEFVYLDEGNWMFARELAGPYAHIDLSTAFVVVLNDRVYEPWMHHEYYMGHYPRYYYLNVYNARDGRMIRGFNENGERPLRSPGAVRAQQHAPGSTQPLDQFPALPVARVPIPGTSRPQGNNTRRPGDERQPVAPVTPAPASPPPAAAPLPGAQRAHPTRTPQPVHYYGANVGKPVKVEPHMMRPHDDGKDKGRAKDKDR